MRTVKVEPPAELGMHDGLSFALFLPASEPLATVVVLHGLWDGLPGWLQIMLPIGIGLPAGQTLVAAVSIALLVRRYREADGRAPAAV